MTDSTNNQTEKPSAADPIKTLDESIAQAQAQTKFTAKVKKKLEAAKELKAKLDETRKKLDADRDKKIEDFVKSYTKSYDFMTSRSPADIDRIKRRLKKAFNKTKAILINMELSNGDHTTFVAYPVKEAFVWEAKTYVVVAEYKYYNHDAQMFCLDYHENFVLPIKRVIPVDQIRKSVASSGITDIENATNPSTLKRFIESEIIEKVMKGQALESALTMLKFVGIATMIGVYLHLVIYVIKSGMLNSIHL